ncbi:hypothetical protein Tco_0505388 [Tanacetum coccineum]
MLVSTIGMVQDPSPVVVKDKGKAKVEETKHEQTKTKLQERQERLGFEAAMKLQEQFDKEVRQRIAREQEKASSFNIEEWENIQARIQANEEIAARLQAEEREELTIEERSRLFVELIEKRKKYFAEKRAEERRKKPLIQAQQRTYMSNYIKHMGNHTLQQLRRYSFDELKELFEITMKNVNTFRPMKTEDRRSATVSEAEGSKRTAEEELDQQDSKRQKTSETSGPVQDKLNEEEKELSQEEDLVKLWSLVKERFSSTEPTDDKERTLWVELKRSVKPNANDELWKLQRYMYDPLKWRLYDTCGVYHVSTERGHNIFMLVEKDYPLSKGVLMLMMVNKLLVDQPSEMAKELIRKIFIQAERPRY